MRILLSAFSNRGRCQITGYRESPNAFLDEIWSLRDRYSESCPPYQAGERIIAGAPGFWIPALFLLLFVPTAAFSQTPELTVRTGHLDWVQSIAYSPDAKLLAGAGDKTIKLWSAESGNELRTFKGFASDAVSVVFGPDGTILAGAAGEAGREQTAVTL